MDGKVGKRSLVFTLAIFAVAYVVTTFVRPYEKPRNLSVADLVSPSPSGVEVRWPPPTVGGVWTVESCAPTPKTRSYRCSVRMPLDNGLREKSSLQYFKPGSKVTLVSIYSKDCGGEINVLAAMDPAVLRTIGIND
jgi:hypothetical protein